MSDLIITTKEELGELIRTKLIEVLNEGKEDSPVPEILDLKQAAEFLKLKVQTIYGYTSNSQIPYIKKGKKLYFEKSKLEVWLKEGSKESITEIRKKLGN